MTTTELRPYRITWSFPEKEGDTEADIVVYGRNIVDAIQAIQLLFPKADVFDARAE